MSKLHESCLASPLSTKINLKPSRENADFSNGDFPWVSPGASNHLVGEEKKNTLREKTLSLDGKNLQKVPSLQNKD